MKKSLVMALCIALCAALATSGTLAYLQDQKADVNVMTLGSVYIEQHEYQRAEGVAHNAGEAGAGNGIKEGELVPFVQGQPLYPAVPTAGAENPYTAEPTDLFYWGDYVYSGTAGNGLWNDDKLANVLDKMIFVENTGKSDAYFRTIIAFECPEDMAYSQGSDKEFMMNVNGSDLYEWTPEEDMFVTIDGVRYLIVAATYQEPLKPGDTAHPSLLQVVMTHNATNEDMDLLGTSYEIIAISQAVQTAGFADAETALTAAFGAVNDENVAKWFGGVSGMPVTAVSTAAELEAALAAGGTVVVENDIALTDEALNVAKDTNLVVNGTLSALNTKAGTTYMIEVKNGAKLTLSGTGTIVSVGSNPDTDWNPEGFPTYATNTISNRGELVIDGVTIENQTSGGASYVVDNYSGGKLTVNSGVLKQTGGNVAIRLFSNSATAENSVTINGGTISGTRAIWIQLPSSNSAVAPLTNVTVNGGTLISDDTEYNLALYSYSYGNSFKNTTVTINDGDFVGHVAFGGGYKGDQETVIVNGGTFSGEVGRYTDVAPDYWEDIDTSKGTKVEKVVVENAADLKAALDEVETKTIIVLNDDISGNVVAEQIPDKEVSIDGNGHTFAGSLTIDGKSSAHKDTGLTIKNINFTGAPADGADAYIRLGDGTSSTRYVNHVTIENCTFDGDGVVAIKSYTGGDKNVTIKNCTVGSKMHSFVQFANVEEGLEIYDCKVYSKNGINLNNTESLYMSGCTIDVTGYAVRFGVDGTVNTESKTFTIENSSLKSACDDGDGVIFFRDSSKFATLNLVNTTVEGTLKVKDAIEGTTTIIGLN